MGGNAASPANAHFQRLRALPSVRVVTRRSLGVTRRVVGNPRSLTLPSDGMDSSGCTISSVLALLFTVVEKMAALSLATLKSSSASNKLVVVSLQFRRASFAQDWPVNCAFGASVSSLQFQRPTAILVSHAAASR